MVLLPFWFIALPTTINEGPIRAQKNSLKKRELKRVPIVSFKPQFLFQSFFNFKFLHSLTASSQVNSVPVLITIRLLDLFHDYISNPSIRISIPLPIPDLSDFILVLVPIRDSDSFQVVLSNFKVNFHNSLNLQRVHKRRITPSHY